MNINVPDRYKLFVIPPGKRKVTLDSFTPHSTTFTFECEDHTIGNLVKGQLLKDPRVKFAGYIMPHPSDHNIRMNLQTSSELQPTKALLCSIKGLIRELSVLQERLVNEKIRFDLKSMEM